MKAPCSLCSAQGRTDCPALGGQICGSCCGAGRNKTINCTADCQFNPFGVNNYDSWLRIDKALTGKKSAYLKKYYSDYEISQIALTMMPTEGDRSFHTISIATTAAVYYLFFAKEFRDGKTVAQLWRDEGWVGLNSDEAAMMNYRMNSSPALVEVQKVLDSQSLECTDILNPERGIFVMYDRTLARNTKRFTRLWLWISDYPFFSRPAGDPVDVPGDIYEAISNKVLFYKAEELKNGNERGALIEALGKRFGEIYSSVYEEARKEKERSLRAMDCHICRGFYAFKTHGGHVKKILDTKPDFVYNGDKHDDALWPSLVYYWLCLGESSEFRKDFRSGLNYFNGQENIPVIGTVFLGEKELMIQALSKRNFEYIKKKIDLDWDWSNLLEFRRESIVDLAQQLADRVAKGEKVVSNNQSMAKECERFSHETIEMIKTEQFRGHYERFLELPVPALDGMTPMQAAKSDTMRPQLIELMKYHIHHVETRNRKDKISIDISWVLEKLELSELM